MLELLDLVQIVDEGFGDLLDKQWSVGHLELDILLDPVELCGG